MDYLLVDMGNTAVKWCLASSHRRTPGPIHALPWPSKASDLRVITQAMKAQVEERFSRGQAKRPAEPFEIVYCSVAEPAKTQALMTALCSQLGCPSRRLQSQAQFQFSGFGWQLELMNSYKVPDQLGADRWAALIGFMASHRLWARLAQAHSKPQGPVVLVSAGTATVMDWLGLEVSEASQAGRFYFSGGNLRPGYGLMAHGLDQATAGLGPKSPPTTQMAMKEGIAQAQVSGIFSRGRPPLVVVHGGFARQWKKDFCWLCKAEGAKGLGDLGKPVDLVLTEGLVLRGLLAWAEQTNAAT